MRALQVSVFYLYLEVLTSKENRINEEIREEQLRVIDEDGNMLGVMSREDALKLADEHKLEFGEHLT